MTHAEIAVQARKLARENHDGADFNTLDQHTQRELWEEAKASRDELAGGCIFWALAMAALGVLGYSIFQIFS